MASQTPAKCQFCEDSKDLHCKCINCDLYLCQGCSTRIHSKNKSSQTHKIINLKDYGSEETAESHCQVDLDHMTCSVHEGQKCISYCCKCDLAICFTCSRETHKDHSLQDLYKIYRENISKMKDFQKTINNNLPFLQAEKSELQQMLLNTKKDCNEIIDKIKAQEK